MIISGERSEYRIRGGVQREIIELQILKTYYISVLFSLKLILKEDWSTSNKVENILNKLSGENIIYNSV